MRIFLVILSIFSLILTLGPTAAVRTAAAQPALPGFDEAPSGDDLVGFRVEVAHSPMNPAEGTTLALVWEVEDDWHVYWKNNGDTGSPLAWDLELPAGLEAGEPMWPAPERYVTAGFIVDNVLEGEVVVLVPLRVREDAAASMVSAGVGELTVRVSSEWLVCDDVCLPGSGDAEVSFNFAATTSSPRDVELFEAARERLPATRMELRRRGMSAGSDVKAGFRDGRLAIAAPGATRVEFFADPSEEGVKPSNALEECAADAAELSVSFGGPVEQAEWIGGVVRVVYPGAEDGEDETVAVIRVDVPGPASPRAGRDWPGRRRDGGR